MGHSAGVGVPAASGPSATHAAASRQQVTPTPSPTRTTADPTPTVEDAGGPNPVLVLSGLILIVLLTLGIWLLQRVR